MAIPRTRYIDAGPAMPQMNAAAAMAPGRAVEQAGQVITQLSERGFQIAEKVRRVDEAGKTSAFFANIDEEAGKFSNSLMTRADTENWPSEWKTKLGEFRGQAKKLGLSPEAQATLERQMDDWGSQRSINFEKTAMLKAVTMGQAQVSTTLQYYGARGDMESYRREAERGRDAGLLNPVEFQQVERDGERLQFQYELDEQIQQDPNSAEQFVQSDSFMENPGATLDIKNQALQQIRQQKRALVGGAVDEFNDGLATQSIRTADDIDSRFSNRVPPSILEKFKEDLSKRYDAAEIAKRSTPEYQSETVGRVSAMLGDYSAELDDYDEQFVEMDSLVRSLPEGSAAKAELSRQISDVRSGQAKEFKSAADIARANLTQAYKGQFFGKTLKSQSTQSAIDAGLLKNQEKLKAAGFNEDQVKEIAEAKNDTERRSKFRLLYPQRAEKKSTSDPYLNATFEAIQSGAGEVSWEDPAEVVRAQKALGEASTKFENWLKANPAKADDDEAVSKKIYEIVSPRGMSNFTKTIIPMMFNESGPIEELPRTGADFTPGVLPPLEIPYVEPIQLDGPKPTIR